MRLWAQEKSTASIATAAAAVFIEQGGHANGHVGLAGSAMHRAFEMAHELGLYGPQTPTPSTPFEDEEIAMLKAKSHTAWGLFCYIV